MVGQATVENIDVLAILAPKFLLKLVSIIESLWHPLDGGLCGYVLWRLGEGIYAVCYTHPL